MSELGKLLKQARIEKGITLEQLQDSTKIRKRYLEAIEEEDFKVLPGSFYARAFIKSYAEAVGLDFEELWKQHQNVIPVTAQAEPRSGPVRSKPKNRVLKNTDRIARIASTLLVLSFFVLILFLIYHYVLSNSDERGGSIADPTRITNREDDVQGGANGGSGTSPTTPSQETPPAVEPEPEPEPEPELTFVTQDGLTYIFNISHVDHVKLNLKVDADCWVQVKKGSSNGEEIKQFTYRKGSEDEWEISESAYIRLGFPRGVQLSVNGFEIGKDMLDSKSPVNFQFNLIQQGTPTTTPSNE